MIHRVAVVGAGALGLLYGDMLQRDPGLSLGYIVDEGRLERYRGEAVSVNGVPKQFSFCRMMKMMFLSN